MSTADRLLVLAAGLAVVMAAHVELERATRSPQRGAVVGRLDPDMAANPNGSAVRTPSPVTAAREPAELRRFRLLPCLHAGSKTPAWVRPRAESPRVALGRCRRTEDQHDGPL